MTRLDEAGQAGDPPAGISVEVWPSTGGPRPPADWRRVSDPGQGIVWLDIGDGQERLTVAEALDQIGLPDYSRALLGHLITGVGPFDPVASGIVPWFDEAASRMLSEGEPVTFLATTALVPAVSPGPCEPPWVFECPVTMLVHTRWVLTCRTAGAAMSDGATLRRGEPYPRERLAGLARRRWRPGYLDGQDLAILILRGVVETFPESLAALAKRLRELQQDYVKGSTGPAELKIIDDHGFRLGLLQVKWVMDGLFIRMFGLMRPGVPVTQRWFPVAHAGDVAEEIAGLLTRSEHDLRDLRDGISSSFALAAATQASEQLALSRAAQGAAERVEQRAKSVDRVIDAIAVVLLGPGLVAGVFAALPGIFDANENLRAVALAAAALLSSSITYVGLRAFRSHVENLEQSEARLASQNPREPKQRRGLPNEATMPRMIGARREKRQSRGEG